MRNIFQESYPKDVFEKVATDLLIRHHINASTKDDGDNVVVLIIDFPDDSGALIRQLREIKIHGRIL